ncbi:MupA/Atu3671 family FMN-dependent luciferase-like monooxygenase [Sorangium sp. So ce1097]|uniref:MupA/Atu3671 family FMN-dependent luciferase-like monooxygenase n=1 Tax=Sorangium sp. So ce1097 TaxID=3133330 RepID=UPI003F5DD161
MGLEARIAALSPEQRALLRARLEQRGLRAPAALDELPRRPAPPEMKLSLFFFSDGGGPPGEGLYDVLLDCARFADEHGFWAVWTPERHFHPFGGPYPNPSVLGGALATATRRLRVRAGSVVLPLHHPVRVAEEWSVVDNLSGGRAGVAFASGWHPNDFVLGAAPYAERKEAMSRSIDLVRRLWRGETLDLPVPCSDRTAPVRLFPRPVQAELPMWMSTSKDLATWLLAAERGLGVLTGLMEQSVDELELKIRHFQGALLRRGHDPAAVPITVMLHTYVGEDMDSTLAAVEEPLGDYLATHLGLYASFAAVDPSLDVDALTEADRRALVRLGVERYVRRSALIGTIETCLATAARLRAIGVDEIACLVNFGLARGPMFEGLARLAEVRRRLAGEAASAEAARP